MCFGSCDAPLTVQKNHPRVRAARDPKGLPSHARNSLSPAERSERARLAANTRWSREPDRHAATAPGRRAMLEHFEREVDPEGILPPQERAKRAENARQANLARARLKASRLARLRREGAAEAGPAQARATEVEKGLAAAIAEIIEAVPLSDQQRERITEVLRGGVGDGS